MNEVGFRESLAVHKDRVFRHAFYLLKCQEDAEDVTQEAYLRLWRHLAEVERASAGVWLIRTAHRLSIDLLRRRQTAFRRMKADGVAEAESLEGRTTRRLNPESRFDHARRQERILEAMNHLPPQTRSMLLLHYYHGLKYETVAEILETTVAAVKVAVHRGRKDLRSLLTDKQPRATGSQRYENAMQ